MKFLQIICVIVAYIVYTSLGVSREKVCSISVNDDFGVTSPIPLKNFISKFKLMMPENHSITLKKKDTILLICPDAKNFIGETNTQLTNVQCVERDIFKIDDKNIKFADIKCKKIIRGEVHSTNKTCADNKGNIFNIGYHLTSNFYNNLIELCHNSFHGNTFYSTHLLHGQGIKFSSKTQYRPSFGTQSFDSTISVSVAYKQAHQISMFERLLKSPLIARKYINSKSYLSRGHLSPDADFIYPALQFSSYYYINTAPQWQAINGGNWKRLESVVRKTAEHLNDTVKIITGTFGILSLPNINNNSVEIYLSSDNTLAVPEYIWKIVYHQQSHLAIVLIVLNNPFVKGIMESDLLCDNICDDYGWGSKSWMNYSQGFVHCCEYKKFFPIANYIPKIKVSGILRGYFRPRV